MKASINVRNLQQLEKSIMRLLDRVGKGADSGLMKSGDEIIEQAISNVKSLSFSQWYNYRFDRIDDRSNWYHYKVNDEEDLEDGHRVRIECLCGHASYVEFGTGEYSNYDGILEDTEVREIHNKYIISPYGRSMKIYFPEGSKVYNTYYIRARQVKGQQPKAFLRNATVLNPQSKANIVTNVANDIYKSFKGR